ncbi:peptidoglycan-binding protein [Labrenzia sp. PHM005]|uniref:peptidoglycan-binding protein n=1 Tax=Labrenzia sp. PHM005 TaxID=2590016 RepID=UPI00143D05EE|nr:peptidoglycan-binding protein [Labrenzia sp. PHM005]
MTLTKTSIKRLKGVHPDLVKVVMRAADITGQPFQVSEGVRTLARQRQLVKRGASKTMNSRHLSGHAVDLVAMVGSRVSWEIPLYYRIADAMKEAAKDLNVRIKWGGDWRSFFDGPHFQLPWKGYPKNDNPAQDGFPPYVSDRVQALATKVLRIGDQGIAVENLQKSLVRLGHPLLIDGDFGPKTRHAVQAFQRSHDLTPDGVVGARTRVALKRALSKS